MPKTALTKFEHLTDQELVILIKQNQDYLGEVYKRCKPYCIQYMRKMSSNKMNDYELSDIYQDAILVLYEKIVSNNFELTASLQTYLNSVCRFQLWNKYKIDSKSSANELDIDDVNLKFNPSITDTLDDIEDEKESQFIALEKALEAMKKAGGHCYELITLFWYHKKSMAELTQIFGYTNEVNTRNQKSRCQKRLEKIAYNALQS